MSGVLYIGEEEKAAIAAAVAAARANPTPWEAMSGLVQNEGDRRTDTLMLDERQHPEETTELRRQYPPQRLRLGTYTICLSFMWQPTGLMRHLSISARDPGKVPGEEVVSMVIKEFGFSDWPPKRPYRVWVEEFAPGHMAINLVELEPA
jgi:hypothetical protein